MLRAILFLCVMILVLGCKDGRRSASDENAVAAQAEVHAGDTDHSWTVTGEVVDDNGLLVEAFEAAETWSSNGVYWNKEGQVPSDDAGRAAIWKQEGVLAVRPSNLATITSKGVFSLTVSGSPSSRPNAVVFAVNKERTHGGLVVVENNASDRPIRIELKPLVRVTADIYCPDRGKTPEWCQAVVTPAGGDYKWFVKCGTYQGKVSFLLPAGEYEIRADSEDLPPSRVRIKVPTDVEKYDAGVIALKLPRGSAGEAVDIADFYGKPPPALEITDARGVPRGVKLEDYRGKWVVLEFWSVWCLPCVRDSLPVLREFYEHHAASRDRFEILAVCDTSSDNIRSIQEFDLLSASLVKDVWGGKQLPFPVLLDGEGRTSETYGIVSRPTLYLIDPAGNLVRDGDLKMLADLLQNGSH